MLTKTDAIANALGYQEGADRFSRRAKNARDFATKLSRSFGPDWEKHRDNALVVASDYQIKSAIAAERARGYLMFLAGDKPEYSEMLKNLQQKRWVY